MMMLAACFMAFQYVAVHPRLPDLMAVHFATGGAANGWQDKSSFWIFYVVLVFGLWALLFGLGMTLRWIPRSLVNVPNREYWLRQENWPEARSRLQSGLEWYASLQAWFMIWMMYSLIQANLQQVPRLSSLFWLQLTGLLVCTAVWLIWFIRQFKTPV